MAGGLAIILEKAKKAKKGTPEMGETEEHESSETPEMEESEHEAGSEELEAIQLFDSAGSPEEKLSAFKMLMKACGY